MRSLASYIMRGRMQAVLITVLFAGLSLPLPPLLYLSGGAVALVTLRTDPKFGLSVVLIAGLIMSLVSVLATGSMLPAIVFMSLIWLPIWFLSTILRQSVSLSYVITIACGIGLLLTIGAHLLIGDPVVWWQQVLDQLMAEMGAGDGISESIEQIARLMTAIVVVALLLNVLFGLLLGRWWQSMLYNPGGFAEEFRQLRLPKSIAWITIAVMLVSILAQQGAGMLAGNLMIVLVFFYLLQGVAIIHNVVAERKLNVGWLVGFYFLMIIALPQVALLLLLMGVSDAWLDIRARIAGLSNKDDQNSPD